MVIPAFPYEKPTESKTVKNNADISNDAHSEGDKPSSDSQRTMPRSTRKFVPYTLTQLRNGDVPKDRPIHIFTEGVYDIFHYGHMRQLRQVKEAFLDVKVTAGICSDDLVIKFKGGPLVMKHSERLASVAECKYVDNVIDHGMFYPTVELLDELEADLIAHDDSPYGCPDGDDCYKAFKDIDRFLATQRTKDISTTNLIQRIVDQSEKFRERNMKRDQVVDSNWLSLLDHLNL